ncbi:uncharacterized protein N7511_009027 [Penicillium nucicola]|uniref:uncharacterized protein n=1 Tax=Penicillium nucicola TaxID=1850975 RepID=UPI0025452ED8|nr:uncharacterized protein N7511_009027 [Penicillium nucicola]KAJ5747331.1 hypothetical protein N7511_009027 [Penicillium nucicola]
MALITFLAVRYYTPGRTERVTKAVMLQAAQFQADSLEFEGTSEEQNVEILPSKLTEATTDDAEDEQSTDEVEETTFYQEPDSPIEQYVPLHQSAEDVTIVAAAAGSENTDWIQDFCDEYQCIPYLYSLNEVPSEDYLTPYSRRGHEASAYLTYIIDNYYRLAPYTIFIHGREEHWHNDIAGPRTRDVLVNLRYEPVSINGYVNLRCASRPGCPSTMFQAFPVEIDEDYQYLVDQLPQILWELLRIPPSETPDDIGHQCCAQFAVSRERIQERPLEDYIRIMNWIGGTDITDNYGLGWLIEKLWHMIFGMPAVQ